jgi:hypothetical protein
LNFLVRCTNKECNQLIVVDRVQVLGDLIFSEMAKAIVCPICKQKILLTLEIKNMEDEEDGKHTTKQQ